jgi:hypothetical protein
MNENQPAHKNRLFYPLHYALLTNFRKNWVAVTGGIEDNHIFITVYVEGEVTEDDTDRLNTIGGEALAQFPDNYTIDELCIPFKQEPLKMLDFWMLLREDAIL